MTELQAEHIAYWRKKRDEQRARYAALATQARAHLPQIIELLTREFGATKIILFGSLAKGQFSEGSDIDLAVAGIPKRDFFYALAAVNRLSDVWIDLKPLEDLDEHFAQRIMTTGELLYESTVR